MNHTDTTPQQSTNAPSDEVEHTTPAPAEPQSPYAPRPGAIITGYDDDLAPENRVITGDDLAVDDDVEGQDHMLDAEWADDEDWDEDDEAEREGIRARKRREREDAYDPNAVDELRNARERQRALMVGVLFQDEDLSELAELLKTAGVEVVGQIVQRREDPHPNTYVGPGKVTEVKRLAKELDANVIVTDDELSARQERNLEDGLKMAVIDRTALILDIFAAHAHSAEGKLQVELAQLQYNMARMRGLWQHLDRLGDGGVGTRGPGETQIETDRRLARGRMAQLRRRLKDVSAHRDTMRAERTRAALPSIALAGYTNAGKSTLLHALSGAEIATGDQLFHTLDPATRTARLNGRSYLITDTVGFIRKLPHQLVDAFGATLVETKLADLVLHVIDASEEDEMRAGTIKTVENVLEEIGAGERPRLLVLNKIDRLSEVERRGLEHLHPDAVQVSAVTGEGMGRLIEVIEERFSSTATTLRLLIPHSEGQIVAELYKVDHELTREDVPEGVRLTVRVPNARAAKYERWVVDPAGV
ncbi:MAG: GTPase HflX [Solirubrobacteraceae bacterium]|nr:GTPase HflX [Patulibacter sp.]